VIPGLSQLPVEFQLLFWIMILFLGTLCSLVVYWTKRYIDSQDQRLQKHESKLNKISEDLSEASKDMRQASAGVKLDFLDFRKEVSITSEKIKTETMEIRKDLSIAQTRMITLMEGLEDASRKTGLIIKILESETKRLSENIDKTTTLELNQSKVLTVLKQLSDRVILISTKKDDGSKS
jgi:hypothetical protein